MDELPLDLRNWMDEIIERIKNIEQRLEDLECELFGQDGEDELP